MCERKRSETATVVQQVSDSPEGWNVRLPKFFLSRFESFDLLGVPTALDALERADGDLPEGFL